MAKKIDPAKAKAARQKKIAIVLGVLFVGLLAFQVPRTMKMLKGPAAAAPAAEAAPAPEATTTAAGTAPPPGTPSAAGVVLPGDESQPAVLADSDLPSLAGEGQLLSFERFTSKDPFAQQAEIADPGEEETDADTSGKAAPSSGAGKTPSSSGAGAPTGSVVAGSGSAGGAAAPADGAASPSAPVAEPVAPPANATSISVNGTAEDVTVDKPFPLEDPVFVLVSAAADGKSVQLGIAGGNYADGKDTITLKLGKPLTLQNTADGSRYELELLTVQGFAPPKTAQPKQ